MRWPLHLLRGVLGIAMLSCFVYALRTLPLAEAYSIFFVAPLLITALSVPLLGERVGPRRWIAIVVGLLGVLVVLRPTGDGVLSWPGWRCCWRRSAMRCRRSPCACWRAPTATQAWCSG